MINTSYFWAQHWFQCKPADFSAAFVVIDGYAYFSMGK